jgi:hypothetical protein
MKVIGPVHKSDVGGVVLNIDNDDAVARNFDKMMTIPDATGVLMQPMLSGTELFLGIKQESDFGHLIFCGLGGIFIEVLKDVRHYRDLEQVIPEILVEIIERFPELLQQPLSYRMYETYLTTNFVRRGYPYNFTQDLNGDFIIRTLQGSENGDIEEINLATNPSMEGDATALYLSQQLARFNIRVTRIARGLPSGGDLEYADQNTILRALSGRQEMSS